jgi:hypothetical protein
MNILFNRNVRDFYGNQSDKFYSVINSALSFYEAHPKEEEPDYAILNGEVLMGNGFDLHDYMVRKADERELYVSPTQFAEAAVEAWSIKTKGSEAWLDGIKGLVDRGIKYTESK